MKKPIILFILCCISGVAFAEWQISLITVDFKHKVAYVNLEDEGGRRMTKEVYSNSFNEIFLTVDKSKTVDIDYLTNEAMNETGMGFIK